VTKDFLKISIKLIALLFLGLVRPKNDINYHDEKLLELCYEVVVSLLYLVLAYYVVEVHSITPAWRWVDRMEEGSQIGSILFRLTYLPSPLKAYII